MRVLYGERASVLLDCIKRDLRGMVEEFGGEAGMHLTVTLKSGGSDMESAGRAARQKLWLWPLPPTRANRHVKGSSWGLAVPNWRTFPAPSASSVACSHETSGQRHSFPSISHQ
jgi:hypothetical protein